MIIYDGEMVDVQDIFENEDVVLSKCIIQLKYFQMEVLTLGVKDDNGDIARFIEIKKQNI